MREVDRHEAFELASPFPYVLVVTLDKRERPNIIGISWWSFTSWDPLMLAISVGQGRYSHECLQHNGEFVLCFPSEDQAKDSWLCGTRSGRDVDKFQATGFRPKHSVMVKPPIIEGVTVAYECRVVDHVRTGDHTLFIGEVVARHGDRDRASHLYSIHYRKLVSIDCSGNVNFNLKYQGDRP
jgi:flavin reductase (DIM6/NTAB) family NADH-FMN oxidoreductase RutF